MNTGIQYASRALTAGLTGAAIHLVTNHKNFSFTKSIVLASVFKDVVLFNADKNVISQIGRQFAPGVFNPVNIDGKRAQPSLFAYLTSFAVFALTLKFSSKMSFGQALTSSAVLITSHSLFKFGLGMNDFMFPNHTRADFREDGGGGYTGGRESFGGGGGGSSSSSRSSPFPSGERRDFDD